MIGPGILVLISFLVLFLIIRLAKGRGTIVTDPSLLARDLRPVDVDAFRNLVDPGEDEFLRSRLRPGHYRVIHRERLRAAVQYISGAAQNAAILLRMGEAARHSSNPVIAEAGDKLVDSALRLRLFAFRAMANLYLAILIPGARISPAGIMDRYERMTGLVVTLGRLQYPTRGVGLSAAL